MNRLLRYSLSDSSLIKSVLIRKPTGIESGSSKKAPSQESLSMAIVQID